MFRIALLCAAIALAGCQKVGIEGEPVAGRSGASATVWADPATGCEYLSFLNAGVQPRVSEDGYTVRGCRSPRPFR